MIVRKEEAKEKILRALGDNYSRAILLSTIDEALPISEISARNNIPISTAYRRARELIEAGLLAVERSEISEDGKRYDLYRSAVKSVKVYFENGRIEIALIPNEPVLSKFIKAWSGVKEHAISKAYL
jgi:DNA-binding transcriptional ArsR family regulator